MKHNVLLVDDDPAFRRTMSDFLEEEGFFVRAVSSGDEGIALIRQKVIPFSLALVDYHMPDIQGPETIRKFKELDPALTVLALSGDDSVDAHNTSLDSGAVFFVEKDIGEAKLLGILHRACREVERRMKPVSIATHPENQKLIASVGMIGVSESMAEIARLILKFGPSNDSVLIRGENGTGKEKVARAIHNHSSRSNKPFVAVNCAAIPENLIESELFGHEKGAFTGAARARKGHFEVANGGTIFLDEIGEMPRHLQATLLRVLQEKTITPVGSTENRRIDFRLISATNALLENLIAEKSFREDLFFRINVLPINIKPLRNRPEDIPVLAQAFLEKSNAESGENKILLASTAEELKKLTWPGNVRELEHCIRFLVNLSSGQHLDVDLLKSRADISTSKKKPEDLTSLKFSQMSNEKNIVLKALEEGGSIAGAARNLGISRSTVREKMKKYGIELKRTNLEEVEL
ncbi:MAG: sigma-54-dependent Fis family transcriptional regulator [Bdellovibrionaceae bacterium]|nr:sigma-54-dependent Fis family transcriptional regulator [Pseudobdellovibrionaceae bacterium]